MAIWLVVVLSNILIMNCSNNFWGVEALLRLTFSLLFHQVPGKRGWHLSSCCLLERPTHQGDSLVGVWKWATTQWGKCIIFMKHIDAIQMDHIFSQELRGSIEYIVNCKSWFHGRFFVQFIPGSGVHFWHSVVFLGYRTVPLISLQVWSLVIWTRFDLFWWHPNDNSAAVVRTWPCVFSRLHCDRFGLHRVYSWNGS